MSIIFQKLDTLKKSSAGPEEFNRQRLQNGIPVYTFRKLIFSPRGVLIISTTLLAFGMISFYALSLLKGYLDSASGKAIVVNHQTKGVQPGNQPASKEQASPPDTDAPENTLVYLPKSFPDESLDEKFPVLLKKPSVPGSPTESTPPVKNSKMSLRPETSSSEVKIKAQQEALRAEKEKRTRKTSVITLLAEDLEEAVGKNDTLRTHILFEALEKENKQNSPYYLKLKAFQEIREENYESAKRILNQILDRDMNDFDANFNMAVIEIREQKLNAAKQRLIRLKEIHPSKASIDDLLNSF